MFTGVIKLASDVKCKDAPAPEKQEAKKGEELVDNCIKEALTEETEKKYEYKDVVGKYSPDFSKTDSHLLYTFHLNNNGTYEMVTACDETCTTGGVIMYGVYFIDGNRIVLNHLLEFNQTVDNYGYYATYEGTIKEDGSIEMYKFLMPGDSREATISNGEPLVYLRRIDNIDRSEQFRKNFASALQNVK